MDSLSNWAWWIIVGGILLSPVFAFLLAILAEILIGLLSQGGAPELLILAVAVMSAPSLIRKRRIRTLARNLLGDQA